MALPPSTKAVLKFWPKGGKWMTRGDRYRYNLRKLDDLPHHALCSVSLFTVPPCTCFKLYAPMIFGEVVPVARPPVVDRVVPTAKVVLCRLWDRLRKEFGAAGLTAVTRFTSVEWRALREGLEGFLKLGDLYHGMDGTPVDLTEPEWKLKMKPDLLPMAHVDYLLSVQDDRDT